jgi:hypothetical protein
MTPFERLLKSVPWQGAKVSVLLKERSGDDACLDLQHSGETVGALKLSACDAELHIRSLEIEQAFRGYGSGSETAYMLLGRLPECGFTRVRAVAAPNLGLSVYFWTRMGLHPIHGAGPCGGLWFERELA